VLVEIDAGEEAAVAAKLGARRPWPAALPEQVKAVAEVLTAAGAPLADGAIAACFTGRGAWKKSLPHRHAGCGGPRAPKKRRARGHRVTDADGTSRLTFNSR